MSKIYTDSHLHQGYRKPQESITSILMIRKISLILSIHIFQSIHNELKSQGNQ